MYKNATKWNQIKHMIEGTLSLFWRGRDFLYLTSSRVILVFMNIVISI